MAGDGRALVIQLGCGELTTGGWCPKCLKPSGYAMDVHSLTESGVAPLARIEKCYDCGEPLERGESAA